MKSKLNAVNVEVPGDISSAAYAMVLAAVKQDAAVTLKT